MGMAQKNLKSQISNLKMRIRLLILITISFLVLSPKLSAFAQSAYVLPYPSEMPGSKFYHAFALWDRIMEYWHFGSLSQFRYNREQSDKYLVEAKTLFEYKQYLLAQQALTKSDTYFEQAKFWLEKAKKEQKTDSRITSLFREAALKHIEVLSLVKKQSPETFVWQPENKQSTALYVKNDIEKAILVRQSCL